MENSVTSTKNVAEPEVLAREIVSVLIEKKGLDVKMFDVRCENTITDFYVNVTGRSSTQVNALADEVTYKMGLLGRVELRVEGRSGGSWLLVDYGDVIVNVFDKASREFYNFDRHLPEKCLVDISDIVAEVDKKYEINTVKEI